MIEKKGRPPCPDLCRMIVGEWYLLRHRRKLIPVDLEGPNIEEGVAAMNAYHPISYTAEWQRFGHIKL